MVTPAPLVLAINHKFLRETVILTSRPDTRQGLVVLAIQSKLGNESIGIPPDEALAFAALLTQNAVEARRGMLKKHRPMASMSAGEGG